MAKGTKGRQKVQTVKIENKMHRQVTFSKCRYGLFKKASELVSLCGAEVGLIAFSPSGKVYTFGHPSTQLVICRYIGGGVGQNNVVAPVFNGLNNSTNDVENSILAVKLGKELNNQESVLENEKKVGKIMSEKIRNFALYNRWGKLSVDKLDVSELLEYKAALERLKMRINAMKLKKSMEMIKHTATSPPRNPNPFIERNNNNFGDPYFEHNNLNTNNENFLAPFDPSFSLGPPNPSQNLGNGAESS